MYMCVHVRCIWCHTIASPWHLTCRCSSCSLGSLGPPGPAGAASLLKWRGEWPHDGTLTNIVTCSIKLLLCRFVQATDVLCTYPLFLLTLHLAQEGSLCNKVSNTSPLNFIACRCKACFKVCICLPLWLFIFKHAIYFSHSLQLSFLSISSYMKWNRQRWIAHYRYLCIQNW